MMGRVTRHVVGPLVVAISAAALHVVMAMANNLTPFGPLGRGVGDYGPQYLPFHLYLHDVLHGRANGDLSFTWSAGGGMGFLPEYTYYLGGPFTALVALFPRDQMDVALLTLSLVRIGVGAAAMMVLLRVLRPRAPQVVAALLAVGYSTSAFVVQLGMHVPMWLDGLWTFPLICLTAIWTVRRQALVGPVLLIALGWWANFYTAIMASLGAGIFLLCWTIATCAPVLRSLLAFALRGVIAVLANAVLLVPTFLANRAADPMPTTLTKLGAADTVASLAGFTVGIRLNPLLFVGSLLVVLLPALVLAALSWRVRVAWSVMVVTLFAMMHLKPIIMLFNGGDLPNGNYYRWSFVVTGLLITAAWHAVAEGGDAPGHHAWLSARQLIVAGLTTGVFLSAIAIWRGQITARIVGPWWWGPLVVLVLVTAQSLCLGRWRQAATFLVVVATSLELAASGAVTAWDARHLYGVSEPYVNNARADGQAASQMRQLASWPTHRTGGSVQKMPSWNQHNVGLRNNLPAVGVYSSSTPGSVTEAMKLLGLDHTHRRKVYYSDAPLQRAVLAVGAVWDPTTRRVTRVPALPMVRTVAATPRHHSDWAGLFNRPVVSHTTISSTRWTDGEPVKVAGPNQIVSRRDHMLEFYASCRSGTMVYMVPNVRGKAVWTVAPGREQTLKGLGQVHQFDLAPGQRMRVRLKSMEHGITPTGSMLCVDFDQLTREIDETPVPDISIRGATIRARFATPQRGTTIISTAAQPGWSCRVDGKPVVVQKRRGLLAVPMAGQREVSCEYRQPGLRLGVAGSAGAVLMLVCLAGCGRLRQRREGGVRVTAPEEEITPLDPAQPDGPTQASDADIPSEAPMPTAGVEAGTNPDPEAQPR